MNSMNPKAEDRLSPITYENFISGSLPDYQNVFYLHGHNGIVTREDIDIIAEHPEMDAIQIYGLKQDTFDYFISRYAML